MLKLLKILYKYLKRYEVYVCFQCEVDHVFRGTTNASFG